MGAWCGPAGHGRRRPFSRSTEALPLHGAAACNASSRRRTPHPQRPRGIPPEHLLLCHGGDRGGGDALQPDLSADGHGQAGWFMFFSSMRPATYRSAHVEIFRSIAGQLSIIVEKARMYQSILQLNEELNARDVRCVGKWKWGVRSSRPSRRPAFQGSRLELGSCSRLVEIGGDYIATRVRDEDGRFEPSCGSDRPRGSGRVALCHVQRLVAGSLRLGGSARRGLSPLEPGARATISGWPVRQHDSRRGEFLGAPATIVKGSQEPALLVRGGEVVQT